ncbi:MAG: tyrosine-type recombinase/integrase, partial [Acidobacteria bacterium]|nr:tyrosine-type recombinase/integrase [Acidobacteriota bacterium]
MTYRIDKERLVQLLKVFRGRRLCDITAADINGYQVSRASQVSPRTVNLETKVLRMILRTGKLWTRLAEDYKPLPENKRGPGRALIPDEEKRLFEVASRNPDWVAAYYAALVAANTTARGCELRGLRMMDIDLIEQTIAVRRVTTKSDAGCRLIPLNETAIWAVARLMERARMLGASEPEHYLFPARVRRGNPNRNPAGYDPSSPAKSWRTAWRELTKAADFWGLRFHDLRHHCITKLAEAGVPEQTLMSIAGHVSRQMLEHYSHIRIQAKRAAVATLESPITVN